MKDQMIKNILNSRKNFLPRLSGSLNPDAAEGGCGVIGFISTEKIKGKHVLQASEQMHNRGNGKGGGIAAVGLDAEQLGVSE
ncbi:MAG: hypothetical protein AAB019_09910, partial [Planctomycetota bacterium]